MERLRGPYNKCASCSFEATQVKYCPFHGRELEHIPPERRCPFCTEVVWYADATFCGMCGHAL